MGSEDADLSYTISLLIPDEHVTAAFKELWACQAVQEAYKQRNKFQLNDSTGHFMNAIDRVCNEDYAPTDDDILRVRVRTIRPTKIAFGIQGQMYEMFDVGGQRGKRSKWIHHFNNVTAVLYVISIAEYDQCLEEDHNLNRMVESMEVFEQALNHECLCLTPFIIFFNKYDLFLEKIKHKSIKQTFSNYNGSPHSAEESLSWLMQTYLHVDECPEGSRELYTHTTTATDTDLMKKVFGAVQDTVFREHCRVASMLL